MFVDNTKSLSPEKRRTISKIMNIRRWFPIFLVAALLGLLGLLAYLQYDWLGKISDGERERLNSRLQSDVRRFSDDFNREIQNAYFNFQLNADSWRERNYAEFNQRFDFWRERTTYPNLIKDFYFVESEAGDSILRYNFQNKSFEKTVWTETLDQLKPKINAANKFQPIAENVPALLLPVYDEKENVSRIITVRTAKFDANTPPDEMPRPTIETPKRFGVLIIELNADTIKNQVFPDLVKKYFSETDGANYKLNVVNRDNQAVFQTADLTATDANVNLFNLAPDNFAFFTNRDLMTTIGGGEQRNMVFSRVEKHISEQKALSEKQNNFEVKVLKSDEKPRVRIFESSNLPTEGVWTLNIQHTAGSLEQFISNTRRKNLAVSFGILSLLAGSIILIFVSSQRAKLFAQRQIDFVSAVSHEFRTPLAVIYSAGENLADGVTKEEKQISRYGDLIKDEGRKLSKMVEQILDFAGANSGKKKYDWRETNVSEIIADALAECQPLINEKEFGVEKEIAENLPPIIADKTALSQAIQNLLVNSIKYSNDAKYLKISAKNVDGKIRIAVEDQGIGIAPKDLKHIFEPFYRSKTVVDEQIHGNGLGLSLVKKTVEQHSGKVIVKSEIGKGSQFIIEIPQKIK